MSLEDRLYPLLPLYERLPQGVKSVVGTGYRFLPARWRFGAQYRHFQHLASGVEEWSPGHINEYQLKQLRAVLIQAGSYCPYYQSAFARAAFRPEEFRSVTDLERVPTLEKSSIVDHLPDMISTARPEKERLFMSTGGSTGMPVGFFLQKGVSRPKEQAFLEAQWKRTGYSRGARVAVIRGDLTTHAAGGAIARYDATRNWLLLSSSHLTFERWPEYIEALERFKPEVLHAYPSAALQLADFLDRAGQSWRLPLRCLFCGSERLNLQQKRLLERVFGTRVYRWYGHSERVVLAGEGRISELFYFCPAYGFVEFGPPDQEGLREVIGTSFHNLMMPLIRYRTGDYVRVEAAGDKTGPGESGAQAGREFPWPAVSEIAGREHEFLVSRGGRRISLTAFNMHDAIFSDLYAVQFYQEVPGRAEFRYVPTRDFHRLRLDAIEAGIRRKLGDDFDITFREVSETEKTARGKHRWLVSRL